jgi:protein O-mannosyl-transferase
MQHVLLKNIHQQPSWWLAGIILLAFGIYMPVVNHGWITGVDQFILVDNPLFQRLTAANVLKLFLSPVFGNYQPLALASFLPGMALSGEIPLRTLHLLNLLLHLANIILLFRLAQMLTGSVFAAGVAALLFAVHPLNAEAVAWISARGQLLGSLFFLAATVTYLYRLHLRKKYHFGLITLLFLLALLSNPVAIAFPAALLLIDYLYRRDLRLALYEKRLWFLMSLVFALISVYSLTVINADIMPDERGFPVNLLMGIYALAMLLIKFILPAGLSAFHPFPEVFSPAVILVLLLPFVLWLAVLLFFRRQRALISSLLFFFLAGTASLVFTFYGPGSFRESQAYLPCMGLFILVAAGFKSILSRRSLPVVPIQIALTATLFATVILLGWMSFQRIGIWHNSERLWTSVIESYPDHHHAFFMRGDYHAANGNFVRARFDYARCIERKPDAFMAVNNIGLIYMEEGDLRLAIAGFSKAVEMNVN